MPMDTSFDRPTADASDAVCCVVRPGDRLDSFVGRYHQLGGLLSGADSYVPPLPHVAPSTAVTALLPDHDMMEAISTATWLATELSRPVTLLARTEAGEITYGPEIIPSGHAMEAD
jgi:hypothetical protein